MEEQKQPQAVFMTIELRDRLVNLLEELPIRYAITDEVKKCPTGTININK